MSTVYLNGSFMPAEEAAISPMDRGFLFGDGLYEVIPSHDGKPVGFALHMARLRNGLGEIGLHIPWQDEQILQITRELIERNGAGDLGIYLHVTRGVVEKRFHGFPENPQPTLFGYAFAIAPSDAPNQSLRGLHVVSTEDKRWKRCHIKSTSLLGNVLHFQNGQERGVDECILFNEQGELTEAAACNVFVVKGGSIYTPPLNNELLAGVTRQLLIDILAKHSDLRVVESKVSREDVFTAEEIWLTSSTKEVAPVVSLDNQPVGDGLPGSLWLRAATLYHNHQFEQ